VSVRPDGTVTSNLIVLCDVFPESVYVLLASASVGVAGAVAGAGAGAGAGGAGEGGLAGGAGAGAGGGGRADGPRPSCSATSGADVCVLRTSTRTEPKLCSTRPPADEESGMTLGTAEPPGRRRARSSGIAGGPSRRPSALLARVRTTSIDSTPPPAAGAARFVSRDP
jgi:hypothetical protein